MTEKFYYDYFSMRGVDIEAWSKNFFWPIGRETTTKIKLDLTEEQVRLINEMGQTFEGDCLLIGHLIAKQFVRVVNHYVSVSRLSHKGFAPVLNDKLHLIPKLMSKKRVDFEYYALTNGLQAKRNVFAAKHFLLELKYNFDRKRYGAHRHAAFFHPVYSFCSPNVIDRKYTRQIDDWIRFTFFDEWLEPGPGADVPSKSVRIFSEMTAAYLDYVKEYVSTGFGIELPANICDGLYRHMAGYLHHIASFYIRIKEAVTANCPRHLLTPTAGQPFVRALSLAVREEGGEVTGFPHGYYICHYSSPRQALHEMGTVDKFMAYSPGSVSLMERNLKQNPPPRNNPVKIVHENSPHLLNQWEEWKDKPIPERIKTVMILELFLMPELAGYYVADSMVIYHFYYRLCKTLSDNGYHVIFKRRPKSPDWEGINFFENIPNVRVVYDHLEKPGVVDAADAIFVQYAMSSTLYWSMCTNKTVIYVDAGWEPWYPDVYEAMAKRCRVLNCWYDEHNRQCFDPGELMGLLEKKPEPPDTEFMERYLFPC